MDTCGYFTRTGDVFVAVGECLLSEDPTPLSESPEVIISPALFKLLPEASQAALEPVLETIKSTFGSLTSLQTELPSLEEAYWAFRYIQGYEAWQAQGEIIETYGLTLGPDVAARFAWSKQVTREQVESARAFRQSFRDNLNELLGDNVLVLPTVPDIAPLLTARDEEIEHTRQLSHHLLAIAVLSGFPQVTVPLAQKDGAPLGISLLARSGTDLSLVRMASTLAKSYL
jgi:amidase